MATVSTRENFQKHNNSVTERYQTKRSRKNFESIHSLYQKGGIDMDKTIQARKYFEIRQKHNLSHKYYNPPNNGKAIFNMK